MDLFPYPPRGGQKDIYKAITKTLEEEANLVLESGTGSGKTVVSLSAILNHIKDEDMKLIYITRTNSQSKQVIHELRQINQVERIPGIALQGRKNLCPLVKTDPNFTESNAEELSVLCADRKTETLKQIADEAGEEQGREPDDPLVTKPSASDNTDRGPEGPNAAGISPSPAKDGVTIDLTGPDGPREATSIEDAAIGGTGTPGDPYIIDVTPSNLRSAKEDLATEMEILYREKGWGPLVPMTDDRSPKKGKKAPPTCKHFKRYMTSEREELLEYVRTEIPTAEEFTEYCHERGFCAYEAAKFVIPHMKVICVPYIYVFMPFIRNHLLTWLKTPISQIVLVVDEAHNLPAFGRDLATTALGETTIERAINESTYLGTPQLTENIDATDMCNAMSEVMQELITDFVMSEDGIVPRGEVSVALMHYFSTTSQEVEAAVEEMIQVGTAYRERRRKEGRLPRSYLKTVGEFLWGWFEGQTPDYIPLVVSHPRRRMELYCLNPARSTAVINAFHSSVHMSGTLRPLDEYVDTIGLPNDTPANVYPSPFPPENLKVSYLNDVTTKYEEIVMDRGIVQRMIDHVIQVVNRENRNAVIFFPSYNLMNSFLDSGLRTALKRPIYIEAQGMDQRELMATINRFKKHSKKEQRAVLFSVMSGRVSEGIDFPGAELELALLIGLPYPKPNARQRALQYYYDIKFGKGWEYTVKAPTVRKVLQSVGRLIRSEEDRGLVVILDHRAPHFKEFIPSMTLTADPLYEMATFWPNPTR